MQATKSNLSPHHVNDLPHQCRVWMSMRYMLPHGD